VDKVLWFIALEAKPLPNFKDILASGFGILINFVYTIFLIPVRSISGKTLMDLVIS
jgi:hypothetical protein